MNFKKIHFLFESNYFFKYMYVTRVVHILNELEIN